MSTGFESISLKKLALIIIAAGVTIVFALSGFQARSRFAPGITEEATVIIKQGINCVIEGSDRVPRTVSDCQYNTGDIVSITYKPQQPSIERHELVRSAGQ
ncbi:MAG TPA: hypothetical protein VFS46_01455 [Nitrososphaera sp.]|nr:hypothetical protein [Nitrososphaera sp.]